MTDDTSASVSPTPSRAPLLVALLVVALATLSAFGHTLGFEFLNWDDPNNVYENPYYVPEVTAANLGHFWRSSYFELYMPVTYTLWGLCALLGRTSAPVRNVVGEAMPVSPFPFHALNVVFHVACALLIFGLLWRLSHRFEGSAGLSPGWRAFACGAGALLFALHPVQAESVAWVTGANNVLSGFFGLLALHAYLSYAERTRPARWFLLATFCYVLALLSKPTATALPIVAAVLEVAVLRRPWRRWAPGLLLWVGLAGAMVLITRAGSGSSQQATLPLWGRPFIAGDALAFYLGKLFFPLELSVDYGRKPGLVLGSWWGFANWLVPAAVGVLLWRLRARLRWAGVGALILVAATLPALGFVPFYLHLTNTVGDRYLYLAMLGPALALAWLLSCAKGGRRLAAGVAGLLLLACGVRAWDQARVWRDSVSLFTHTLSVHPRSMAAFTNLGITLASWQGSPEGLDAALRTLPFAWEERPEEAGPGVPLQRRRQLLAALECFRRAVEYQPDVALNQYHLGAALVELHRPQDAVGPFQAAVRLHPPFAEAWFRLGTTLGQTPGREREAIDALTEAARLEPGNVEAHYIRAVLLGNRGKFAEAEAGFQAAARLAPGYADPHFGIGRMREKQDRLVEAIPEYQEAARLAPDNARFADALRDAERRAASDR